MTPPLEDFIAVIGKIESADQVRALFNDILSLFIGLVDAR